MHKCILSYVYVVQWYGGKKKTKTQTHLTIVRKCSNSFRVQTIIQQACGRWAVQRWHDEDHSLNLINVTWCHPTWEGEREREREREREDRERLKSAYKNRNHKLQPSLKWHMMKTWSCVLGESSRGLSYCTLWWSRSILLYWNVPLFSSLCLSSPLSWILK